MKEEHADWRLNPVAEREFAVDRRQERRRRRNVWLLVASSIGLCPFACFGSYFAVLNHSDSGLLALAGVSVGSFVWSFVRYSRDKTVAQERRRALRQEFGDVSGWLVEIAIRQGEVVSGRDVGVVWFEENKLFFAGARTSFGLGLDDLKSQIVEDDFSLGAPPHLRLPLRQMGPVGPVDVGMRFESDESTTRLVATENAFRDALRGWFVSGAKESGQLPPLIPGPDFDSEGDLRIRAIAATAIWPLFAVAFFAILAPSGFVVALLCVAFSVLVTFWPPARSPRRCWRALRDRRRLQAYNKEQ